ncbi:MAG: acyl-CoA dehydrogenase family protein [Gammaproteobacteria bacterium]|nr:acyl-CoA dehydrogenase family protein [Gammaproteobacteria bacterium]
MDLSFGPYYEAFRDEVRGFLAAHGSKAPRVVDLRAPETLAWQRMLLTHGYAGRTIPVEYGGYGAAPDMLEARIIAEEFAQAQVSPGIAGQGIMMLIPTLLEFGTEAQKREFIAPTLRGELIWCQGYSEPNAGSDLASLKTRGELAGDEWVINGQKIWTSTAQLADWMFCLVRTESERRNHLGISFLLIPMTTAGIDVRPIVTMTDDASFNEVFLTEVRIPVENIVGARGEGWRIANALLGHERGMLGNPNVTLQRFNALVDLMRQETVDGHRLIDNPLWRERLMQIQGRMLALRCNDLRLLSARLNTTPALLAGMIVKFAGTELRHDLEGLAIDALGELGVLYRGSPLLRDQGFWQQHYMYFLGLIIGGGTSQIQKNIIAERGLGLPREPKMA